MSWSLAEYLTSARAALSSLVSGLTRPRKKWQCACVVRRERGTVYV